MTVITDYIEEADPAQQAQLKAMYQILKPLLPDATETLSYGMPAFHQEKDIVYFAPMKNHLGFYPTDKPIAHFEDELEGRFKYSKGAVQFDYRQPLPAELITKMVRYRLSEVLD
ncbi:iron chaperone [Levilactobacillus tujiorum]|uniref:YdhG-like domain-containing protein n=1 Tax=Levilactobacillus tujiorum TaxID=2912243 RepID=A0ABX1L3N2_9LACO|nr:DUF1801 domain-containing protein [Levilactobacillus tujiorum]MCH5464604.1 DUF1801 domain-containing protein [Levilactobacillus tujiorum]NLR11714.1 hypothetical protein [Lactobacillus sp. HBUAS51387]NLR29635.1 hypothetical protein [Levilactobacillus tujiorum]